MGKYYVVWEGIDPGVYDNWEDAEEQVKNFPGAKYKSFKNREEAVAAFRGKPEEHMGLLRGIAAYIPPVQVDLSTIPDIDAKSICVDAACSRNPGPVEYRGVVTLTGQELFRVGPFDDGTNNLGEFLAIVHGLAWLDQRGRHDVTIYSDSKTAISWVRQGKVHTTIRNTDGNAKLRQLVLRAIDWLHSHGVHNKIVKWDTGAWGEIPADFGRK